MRSYLIRFLCAALLCTTVFAREEQRINQLKDAIKSVESVMADKNSPSGDRPRLQHKLEGLKRELSILEEREGIEVRERTLKEGANNQTREWLREKLQTVSSVPAAVEARQQQLDIARAKATSERTALVRQREDTQSLL